MLNFKVKYLCSQGSKGLEISTVLLQLVYETLVLISFNFYKQELSCRTPLSFFKNNLEYDTYVIKMDFWGNHSFVIQESAQVFYYNNLQATIHSFSL